MHYKAKDSGLESKICFSNGGALAYYFVKNKQKVPLLLQLFVAYHRYI